MKSKLFWAGAIFQLVQLIVFGIVVLSYAIPWHEISQSSHELGSKVTLGVAIGFIWIVLNMFSLAFLLIGATGSDKHAK